MRKDKEHIYKIKTKKNIVAIQWTENNLEEAQKFTGNKLISFGTYFDGREIYALGHTSLHDGQYIVKDERELVYTMEQNLFENNFEVVE